MNRNKMEQGVRLFLEGVLDDCSSRDPECRSLIEETPRRVVRAFEQDLLQHEADGNPPQIERAPVAGATGRVYLQDIRFTSVCAHHLLPYRGRAHVGFVPGSWHVGLGGIARIIDWSSRRLTMQEALAARAADALESAIAPRCLSIVVEAEHLCLAVRGARKEGHRFVCVERRGGADPDLLQWESGIVAGPQNAR